MPLDSAWMRRPLRNRKLAMGCFFIAIGVIAFAYEGLIYATHRIDGEIEGARVRSVPSGHDPVPPIVGALSFVGGLAVLFVTTASAHRPATLRRDAGSS